MPSGAVPEQRVPHDQRVPYVFRRTWPQRLLILLACGVIVSALAAAWTTQTVYSSVKQIGRVQISSEVLQPETLEAGDAVNFLIVGTDSANRLSAGDPARRGRPANSGDQHNSDTILLLRASPHSGSVSLLSIPRDAVVVRPRSQRQHKINAMTLIGGPELLVEAISDNFGIPVNHFVQADFYALREVVDLLDGVEVYFEYPERDLKSHLQIPTAGLHNLDGTQALAYVRSRSTEQLIDGRWQRNPDSLARPDLYRIERQQTFLRLAADRAIKRGARSLTTLADLLDAAARSLVFDSELTVAALVSLAGDFTDVETDALQCYELQVRAESNYLSWQGTNLGSVLHVDLEASKQSLDIFRGVSDPAADGVVVQGATDCGSGGSAS